MLSTVSTRLMKSRLLVAPQWRKVNYCSSTKSTDIETPQHVFKQGSEKRDMGSEISREGKYQNPDYFQFHKFSYADMEIIMTELRTPQINSKEEYVNPVEVEVESKS